jgi:undecaprenyl-diphosphatase
MIFISILLAAAAVLFIAERAGARTTLRLSIKGDIKRESRFLSQYGQMVCTAIVAVLVWQLDPDRSRKGRVVPTVAGVVLASLIAMILKRLLGRVRPGYDRAGKFIGPIWRHANEHESFPSSHSACAFALSAGLAWMYPDAAPTFWTLAVITAVLRYLMDAHWPSDVLAGVALGYACAEVCWWYCITLHPNW